MSFTAIDIVVFIVAFILGILFLQALKHFSIIKSNTKANEIIEEANYIFL